MREASGCLGALILLYGCSSAPIGPDAQEGEWVEVEGWAPIDPADLPGTRQRALAEAQKKAVEKIAGVRVAASTRVEASITVRQKITADVQGAIRRYDVLEERLEGGFHKTRIRALVSRRRAAEESRGDDPIPSEPPPGNPKASVAILGEGPRAEAGAQASAAVRGRLLAHGFAVVVPGSESSSPKPDFLFRGDVQTHLLADPRLGAFRSCRAKIRLQVVETATGLVILEKSQEASALGMDDGSASSQAAENAGRLIGTTVAEELAALLWRR